MSHRAARRFIRLNLAETHPYVLGLASARLTIAIANIFLYKKQVVISYPVIAEELLLFCMHRQVFFTDNPIEKTY
jgi:hypothetical protein